MAHADMAEGVEHVFVGEHAVGERDLVADVGEIVGHGTFPVVRLRTGGPQQSRITLPIARTHAAHAQSLLAAAHPLRSSRAKVHIFRAAPGRNRDIGERI